MKISSLLIAVTLLLALIAAAAAILGFGTGIDADAATYLAIFVFYALILGLIAWARVKGDGLLLLLAGASLLAYGQSMAMLLWDFTSFNLYNIHAPTAADFTRAVWWATGGTIAIACGLSLIPPVPVSQNAAEDDDGIPLLRRALPFLILCGFAVLGINLILTVALGVGAAATVAGPYAALSNLFSRDLVSFMTLIATARYWRDLSRKMRVASVLLFGFYLLVTIYQGSRGGLVLLGVMALVTLVTEFGDFFIPRRALLYLLASAVLTGVLVWPFATRIRAQRNAVGPVAPDEETAISTMNGGLAWSGIAFLQPLLMRQGRIPQLIGVANDWVPHAANEVPAVGIPLNIIAGLFPGPNPDPDVYPPIGRGYALVYRNTSRSEIFADEWSPTALALFYLPGPLALLALALWGVAVAAGARALAGGRGGFAHYVRVNFVYNLGFAVFASGVIDILAPQFLRWCVLGGALLVFYRILEEISSYVNRDLAYSAEAPKAL